MKKKTPSVLALALILALSVGQLRAMAQLGGEDDPLITLSYLNQVVKPALLKDAAAAGQSAASVAQQSTATQVATLEATLEQRFASLSQTLQSDAFVKRVAERASAEVTAVWQIVDLPSGKTLTGSLGTEFLLRSGAGSVVGSVIDLSSGAAAAAGGAASLNHLYLVNADGGGLRATQSASLFVKGHCTIS